MTLTRAILAAGGYGEFSRKPVYLERHKTARRVDLRAIVDRRAPDLMLEPADVIIVGRSPAARP
jgi:protein involved in polysaccharide export with SLBB domain